jgi:GT2 family glycosyltransferase
MGVRGAVCWDVVASTVTPRRAEISVAIATRDRPLALARCLESLQACRVLPAEVVVADQSAGSDARQAAQDADGPRLAVRCIDGGSGGLAGAQQAAFDQAAMALVAVLDDDCVADPEWIEAIERAFADEPQLALVCGRVVPLPGEGLPVASRTSEARRRFRGRSLPWNMGSGNNFALRREWFERVGGCDERLGPGTPGRGGLDMDLFYRLLRAGGTALYEPAAVVQHQRATAAERLGRRHPYGFGIGAACALHLRAGDLYIVPMLAAWIALRVRLVAAGLLRRRFAVLREEALVLAGTAAGIVHGMRLEARDG